MAEPKPARKPAASAEAARRFATPRSWETWLKQHHATSDGVWLQIARKGGDGRSVTHDEAVEIALCYGWIDGLARGGDPYWLQRFTPRRTRSVWSKINRERALALIASGRMHAAGLKEVERAQADGRWADAYDSPRNAAVPPDLAVAFEAHPQARAYFETLNGANRYAVLWRIQTAKRADTRARRIAQFVAMLARHEKIHA